MPADDIAPRRSRRGSSGRYRAAESGGKNARVQEIFTPRRAQARCGGNRAAAGAHPHRPCRRQGRHRLLGPLGARGQRRDEGAVHRVRQGAPGGRAGRLHHLRGLEEHPDHRCRGPGEDWPRRAAVPRLGGAEPRRSARADRRRDAAAQRQIRPDQRGERVPVQDQGPLDGGAGERRQPEQGTVRPDFVAEAGRARRPGDVPERRRCDAGRRGLDLRQDAAGRRGLPENGQDVRHRSGRHRRIRWIRPVRCSPRSAPRSSAPRATSR